jgi:hypothetical protein
MDRQKSGAVVLFRGGRASELFFPDATLAEGTARQSRSFFLGIGQLGEEIPKGREKKTPATTTKSR